MAAEFLAALGQRGAGQVGGIDQRCAGVQCAVAGAGSTPGVAAAVLSIAPWPSLFLVHVPLALLGLAVGARALPDPPREFTLPEVIIGRDPTCNLRLDDKTISARHARLSYHHKQWWVEDLHSTNGAFLNTENIVEPIVVATGDLLRCGEVEFEIKLED